MTGYPESPPGTVEWLARVTAERPWQEPFPILTRALGPYAFDHEAEDRWLAAR
ncbi:hypothetical protein ACIGXM_26700 [Kitasatospora sp. NPDC052896]|uniref:hypothetical protein n=1 Tax=Kitasatospora sp. NPDC052896 TaxID=3364061 RepID=UPI0037CCA757